MNPLKIDTIGFGLIAFLFILLGYSGYLAYISIDNDVLKKLESQPLILPSQAPTPTQSINLPSIKPQSR